MSASAVANPAASGSTQDAGDSGPATGERTVPLVSSAKPHVPTVNTSRSVAGSLDTVTVVSPSVQGPTRSSSVGTMPTASGTNPNSPVGPPSCSEAPPSSSVHVVAPKIAGTSVTHCTSVVLAEPRESAVADAHDPPLHPSHPTSSPPSTRTNGTDGPDHALASTAVSSQVPVTPSNTGGRADTVVGAACPSRARSELAPS